jgi:hypothetical protein
MKINFYFILLFAVTSHAAKMQVKSGQFFTACKLESKSEECFIDTGAFTARVRPIGIISRYPSLGKTKSKGLSGEMLPGNLVRLDSIVLDNLKQHDVTVATLPQEFPYSVLGIEFFKSFSKVTFNFDQLEIKKGLLSKKNLCPSKMNLNNQLIQLEVKLAGRERFAAFDTGASITVINKALIEANPQLFKFSKDIPAGKDSAGKPTTVKMYVLKSLGLCGMDYQDVNVVAVDMTEAKKAMPEFPEIFLGANLMVGNSWAFDFSKKRWYLE